MPVVERSARVTDREATSTPSKFATGSCANVRGAECAGLAAVPGCHTSLGGPRRDIVTLAGRHGGIAATDVTYDVHPPVADEDSLARVRATLVTSNAIAVAALMLLVGGVYLALSWNHRAPSIYW